MTRSFIPLVLAACFLAVPAGAHEGGQRAKISVTGEGEALLSPDMAIVHLAVVREAETAREAMDANNEAMQDVIASLKEAGVEDRDLQTSGLSIQPQYVFPNENNEETERRIVGYEVSNGLTVRIRNLENVGEILDRSVTLGVNQGGSISFTNDDPSEALDDARKRAVEDALGKARILTEAAGVSLGDVLAISENMRGTPPPMPFGARAMRMEASVADAVPVEAGENSYKVQVNVTFEIEQE